MEKEVLSPVHGNLRGSPHGCCRGSMVHFGLDQALEGVDDLSFSFNFTAPISMISRESTVRMFSSIRILVPFQVKYNIVHGFSVLLTDSVHRHVYGKQTVYSLCFMACSRLFRGSASGHGIN